MCVVILDTNSRHILFLSNRHGKSTELLYPRRTQCLVLLTPDTYGSSYSNIRLIWNHNLILFYLFFLLIFSFLFKQYQFLKLTLFTRYLYRDQIYKKFGIQLAFIATRSGLMRYSDHSALFRDPNYRPKLDPDIIPEP